MPAPAMSGEKSIGKGSEKSAICCRSGREMRDFCVIFVKKRVIVAENGTSLLQSYKKADEPPCDSENILKESIAKTISPCRKDPKRGLSL